MIVGRILKAHIKKRHLSVTQAAKLLKIGRPALSNVLNGNAALSPMLALKIEDKFNLDARYLLVKQIEEELCSLMEDGQHD